MPVSLPARGEPAPTAPRGAGKVREGPWRHERQRGPRGSRGHLPDKLERIHHRFGGSASAASRARCRVFIVIADTLRGAIVFIAYRMRPTISYTPTQCEVHHTDQHELRRIERRRGERLPPGGVDPAAGQPRRRT